MTAPAVRGCSNPLSLGGSRTGNDPDELVGYQLVPLHREMVRAACRMQSFAASPGQRAVKICDDNPTAGVLAYLTRMDRLKELHARCPDRVDRDRCSENQESASERTTDGSEPVKATATTRTLKNNRRHPSGIPERV